MEDLETEGVPTVSLNATSRFDLAVVGRLARELVKFHPDILQTWLFHANVAGRFAGRRAKVPHILSGIRVAERRARWPLWLDRWTSRSVAAHVCVSEAVAEFSVRVAGLPAGRVRVIPNGVDAAKYASAPPTDLCSLGIPTGARVLLSVGRLDEQKGLRFLLESIPVLAAEHDDVHWLLAGKGPLEGWLLQRIQELGLADRIHLAGFRTDVASLMRASTALVLPSLWEGMPNVVLEALSAGLPVVATRVEGVEDLVTPGVTGWLVPAGDAGALGRAQAEVLGAHERLAEMGRKGQELVVREYTWERMISRYDALYREILADQFSPRG